MFFILAFDFFGLRRRHNLEKRHRDLLNMTFKFANFWLVSKFIEQTSTEELSTHRTTRSIQSF